MVPESDCLCFAPTVVHHLLSAAPHLLFPGNMSFPKRFSTISEASLSFTVLTSVTNVPSHSFLVLQAQICYWLLTFHSVFSSYGLNQVWKLDKFLTKVAKIFSFFELKTCVKMLQIFQISYFDNVSKANPSPKQSGWHKSCLIKLRGRGILFVEVVVFCTKRDIQSASESILLIAFYGNFTFPVMKLQSLQKLAS